MSSWTCSNCGALGSEFDAQCAQCGDAMPAMSVDVESVDDVEVPSGELGWAIGGYRVLGRIDGICHRTTGDRTGRKRHTAQPWSLSERCGTRRGKSLWRTVLASPLQMYGLGWKPIQRETAHLVTPLAEYGGLPHPTSRSAQAMLATPASWARFLAEPLLNR